MRDWLDWGAPLVVGLAGGLVVIALVVILVTLCAPAEASYRCGMAPLAPAGCHYVCVCESAYGRCSWTLVCS